MLRIPQSEMEYRNALVDAAEMGALKARIDDGTIKPYLKLREAQRLYGTAIVNRWIKERLVIPVKDGERTASLRIDKLEIAAVAKTANRATYLSKQER